MIKITLGTNTDRQTVIVDPSTTIRQTLENNGIDYTAGSIHLDGASLKPGDMDKSFGEMGITEKAYLINVVKADGGK